MVFLNINYYIRLLSLFVVMFFSLNLSANNNLDVFVVKAISDKVILPGTKIISGSLNKNTINISACNGEYEPTSLIMRANYNISSVSVEVSDLKSINNVISSSNVDIKIVKVWYQGGGAWESRNLYKYKEKKLIPELLLNDEMLVKVDTVNKENYLRVKSSAGNKYIHISKKGNLEKPLLHTLTGLNVQDSDKLQSFNLARNENKQLWLTFNVPKNSINGLYKGVIKFKDKNGAVIKELNIQLNVLPFLLAKPSLIYSIYYRGKLNHKSPTVSSEFKNKKQLMAELLNMKNHGVTNPSIYQSLSDIRLLEEYLLIRDQLLMNDGVLYYLGIMTYPNKYKTLKNLGKMTSQIVNIAKKHNITTVYVYGIDEAKDEKLKQQYDAWKVVHESGAKIFVAGYKGTSRHVGHSLDALVFAGPPDAVEINMIHQYGNKIFSYNNPQSGPENPLVFRRNYGVVLWKNNYDGAMPYAYQHSFGSAWNDVDHKKFRDHNFTYPAVDGVIDTIAWEGFREGVDDVRYINTLENIIKKAETLPEVTALSTLDAKEYLADLKNGKIDDLDEMRSSLITHILNIHALLD